MTRLLTIAAAAALLPAAAFAEGDAEKGKALFNKCQTCHVVVNPAGETLAGRNAKTGPNLYTCAGPARDLRLHLRSVANNPRRPSKRKFCREATRPGST